MAIVTSTIIAVATFLFTVFKYFHEKKENRRNVEFDQYIRILDRVTGRHPDGKLMVEIQQISAVYQLLEFKNFNYITLPILIHYKEMFTGEEDSSFIRAINNVYSKISQ
ncbi:hypothetical protein ACE3MZ_07025 [Paenibacillus sp. WLX1005]|uniref:hypothetical protein n=1 Tax=Paenibacillus sp. WLX1005 TaxID=3243766 RepID=UPI003983E253